jgi:hypoxia up-regulated 1
LFSNAGSESGGVAGALKGLFGGKKDKKDTDGEDGDEAADEAETNKTAKAVASKKEKIAIRFKEQTAWKAMTGEEKRNTQAR